MPRKVRELKAMLKKAGFFKRPGKGSHTRWWHPMFPDVKATVSGKDGGDAKPYQEAEVDDALRRTGAKR